jgi:hypothetical protein
VRQPSWDQQTHEAQLYLVIHFRVQAEIKRRLLDTARTEGRTLQDVMTDIMASWLQAHEARATRSALEGKEATDV